MEFYRFLIKCCIITGQWKPKNLSKCHSLLYNFYAAVIFFLFHILSLLSQFVLLSKMRSIEGMSNILYILVNSFLACIKFLIGYTHEQEFIDLEKTLQTEDFLPQNDAEKKIQQNHRRFYS